MRAPEIDKQFEEPSALTVLLWGYGFVALVVGCAFGITKLF